MSALLHDVKCSLRVLRRHRSLTLAAIATLALAIGANTAMFSVVHGVLLRPLPFGDVERLVTLWESDPARGVERQLTSPANFLDWQRQTTAFESMAMAEPFGHTLLGDGEPESFRSWVVSPGFFDTLRSTPLLGRAFAPEEHEAGSAAVVILSHETWSRRFGRDPSIIGRTLTLNGRPTQVIGVMPPDFDFPSGRDLWAPRTPNPRDGIIRGSTYIRVVGRLKRGVPLAAAQQELTAVASQLAASYPATNDRLGIVAVPLRDHLVGPIRPALVVLMAAVGLVLLVASANIANLFIAHARGRRREFAIRRALGVPALALFRLILAESLLIALAGGAIGALSASWLVDLLASASIPALPRGLELSLNVPVLLFALALCALSATMIAVAAFGAAGRASAVDVTRGHGDGRLGGARDAVGRPMLVAAQLCLSFVVVVSAGLLFRSYAKLIQVDPGVADGLAVEVGLARRAPADRAAFVRASLERVAAVPGVRSVGATSALPFHGNRVANPTNITIEGRPVDNTTALTADLITVTPTYFDAAGIPLLEGRMFSDADGASTPVAIVNATMARRYWPLASPVGRRIGIGPGAPMEIVGVVGDARAISLQDEPQPEMYVSLASRLGYTGAMTYVVRTTGPPRAVLQQVKDAIRVVNPAQTFPTIATIGDLVDRSLSQRKFVLALFGGFALLALAVAAVGIFGAVTHASAQRTAEIGLRMALGSTNWQVLRLIVSQALRPVVAGIVLGMLASVATARLLAAQLYQVSPLDPVTFGAIAALFAVVSLVAACIPARRASRLDPLAALRHE